MILKLSNAKYPSNYYTIIKIISKRNKLSTNFKYKIQVVYSVSSIMKPGTFRTIDILDYINYSGCVVEKLNNYSVKCLFEDSSAELSESTISAAEAKVLEGMLGL